MSSGSERRIAPRLTRHLPLTLGHQQDGFVTKTENVSASGAYCSVTRYVAPMTKLRIKLELPGASRAASHIITGQGVVVRVEPPRPSPTCRSYNIAIFFNDLSEPHRALLAAYIQQHLTAPV